jgi:alpha-1,2-mannosyltransferase
MSSTTVPAGSWRVLVPGAANRHRWFVAGLLVFFFLLSIQYSYKAVAGRSAFLRWRTQIEQLDDVNIYQRFKYPNPPIMALLLEWLVRLPPVVGSLSWFYLKVAMTLLVFYWVFRLVAGAGPPFPPWAKVVTILLSLRPIMGDLYHNNVNIFILFLLTGSLFAFCRRRPITSGVILGLAIACKVTPALFIPYFLWKRAWRTLAGCTVGLILFLLIVPGMCLGTNRNLELLASWEKLMIEPFVVNGVVASEHNNQSLPGLAYRMMTYSPSSSKFDYELWKYTPQEYSHWLTLTPKTVQWLLKACMAAFALLVIWCCRTPVPVASGQWPAARDEKPASSSLTISHWPRATRRGWPLAAEFSLVVLGMLLFSERTWKHHCVTLVLPCAVILYYLAVERPKPTLRWFMIGILSTVAILMASTSTNGVFTWWDQGAKLAQVYGAYVWAYLLLVLAMIILLKHGSEAESSMQLIAFRVQVSDVSHRSALAPVYEPLNPAVGSPALIPRSTQENPRG